LTKETLGIDAGAGDATPRAILYDSEARTRTAVVDVTLPNLDVEIMWSKFKSRNAKTHENDVILI